MTRLVRLLGGALLVLPALELGYLPTFIPGCELVPPKVTSVYTGPGTPTARPRSASVDVFLAGDSPARRYVVVGELEVSATNRNASLHNLLEYAQREARRLGGDAIVEVRPGSESAEPRNRRVLTAKVVSWV